MIGTHFAVLYPVHGIFGSARYHQITHPFERTKLTLVTATNLMLMRYCAKATASGLPEMVIVRSVTPLSRSSQFDMRIIAPEICLISAILVPPFPIMQPISSFGTVISCVCWLEFCWFLEFDVRSWDPARAANATNTNISNRTRGISWCSTSTCWIQSACVGWCKAS